MDKLYTTGETAQALRLSVAALYALRHRGKGPKGVKVGKKILFRECDIEQWLQEQTEQ